MYKVIIFESVEINNCDDNCFKQVYQKPSDLYKIAPIIEHNLFTIASKAILFQFS